MTKTELQFERELLKFGMLRYKHEFASFKTGRFLLQVTFHSSPVQVTVLLINKQAKSVP